MGKQAFEEKLRWELTALQSAIRTIENRQAAEPDLDRVHDSGTLTLLNRRRQGVEDRLDRLQREGNGLWVNLRDEVENEWDDLVRALAGDPISSVMRH
ncbi:MAG TPA: hypothetical protein VFQ87_15205 [Bradyrhizobium sp.]|jgi:hypothetical protein|nr:hypothetical protein [Bradyrhizobium sp.]